MSGNLPTQHTDTGQYLNMSDFDTGYDDTQLILRGYLEHHPGYIPDLDSDISNDRLLYSQISIAMMQIHAEEPLNVRARQVRAGLALTAPVGRWVNCKNTSRAGMGGAVSRWIGSPDSNG